MSKRLDKWVTLRFDYDEEDETGQCQVEMNGHRYAFTTIGYANHPIEDPRLRFFLTLFSGVARLFDMIPTPKAEYELNLESYNPDVKRFVQDRRPCPTVSLQMLCQCLSELTSRFGQLNVKTLRS